MLILLPYLESTIPFLRSTTVSHQSDYQETSVLTFLVPLPTTGIFIVMALTWGWLSDGPFKGRRYPFIYLGAVITVSAMRVNL